MSKNVIKEVFSFAVTITIMLIIMPTIVFAQPFKVLEEYSFTTEVNIGLGDIEFVMDAQGITKEDQTFIKGNVNVDEIYIEFAAWFGSEALIVEVPSIIQFMISLYDPELAKQYWILDVPSAEDAEGSGEMPLEALGENRYRTVVSNEGFILGDWTTYLQASEDGHITKMESNSQFSVNILGEDFIFDFGYVIELDDVISDLEIVMPEITSENSVNVSEMLAPSSI